MTVRRAALYAALLLCLSAVGRSAFAAATQAVAFQGKVYDVTFLTPDVKVPLFGTNDLIFYQDISGNRYLMLPTDQNLRGDYDINAQRFYILQQQSLNNFNINSYDRIDATVMDLNAQFINSTTLSPLTPYTTYATPIPVNELSQDVCIVDNFFMGLRTDGPTTATTATTDEHLFTITRVSNSTVQATINPNLHNSTAPFIVYDPNNVTYLTIQRTLDSNPAVNTDTRHRISSFNLSDGSLNSIINLDGLDVSLGFSGNTAGMTIDPSTGVIYLLDAGSSTPAIPRKIFTFTPRVPRITSVSPSKGTFKGGTAVTVNGVNLPADAQVFFDGILASNIVVNSTISISCTTPAHAQGAVDVVVTGTGINTQLTLAKAFTYINQPPSAALSASPTSGPPPLTVSFNIGASTDLDGSLTQRVITFGDGQSFTFSSDQSVVDTTHIYLANGTYTATLTVTDDLGATGTATQTIIVGTGGDDISDNNLVLRQLSFTLNGGSKDSVKIRAEFILPTDVPLGSAMVDIGVSGGQPGGVVFSNTLNSSGNKVVGFPKFSLKLLNKRGFDPQTYTLSFSKNNTSIKDDLTASGLNLTSSNLATLTVYVRITTEQGREITHTKPSAVVSVKAGRNSKSSVKLTRN